MKTISLAFFCLLNLFCFSQISPAQDTKDKTGKTSDDVIRIDTRVVFVEVSVKDAKTNAPVRNLEPHNFKVFDEGRQREIAYFSREGDTRRPLSLLIFLDLWTLYGAKYVKDREAMLRLGSALRLLAPEDEVAVMGTWIEEGKYPGEAVTTVRLISDFTRERQKTLDALRQVPEMVEDQIRLLKSIAENSGLSKWDIELEWNLSEIAGIVMRHNAARPQTQFVVAGLIDDLFLLRRGEKREVAEMSARAGVTFYGLIYKKTFLGKLFFGAFNNLIMRPSGKALNAAGYLSEQTGGQIFKVGKIDDLAANLEKIISEIASRYSLGFALDDNERGDGRMRKLEVTVEAKDARGRKRKLKTRARSGYYIDGF